MLAERQLSGKRFRHVNQALSEGVRPPDSAVIPGRRRAVYGKVSFQPLSVPVS